MGRGVVEGGFCCYPQGTLGLGPREDSGKTIVLPEYGEAETESIMRSMQGGAGGALWEVYYLSADDFELSVYRGYCIEG